MTNKQLHIIAWILMIVALSSMALFALGAAMEFYGPKPDYSIVLTYALIAVFSFLVGLISAHYGDRMASYDY